MNKVSEKITNIEFWFGLLALILSGISIIFTWNSTQAKGKVVIYQPSEYCVARGFRMFPSDHLIIPISFENTGTGAKTIDNIALFITDNANQTEYRFQIAGIVPNLDTYLIEDQTQIIRGFAIPEHSLNRYNLLFHIDNWWDEQSPNFIFRFNNVGDSDNSLSIRLGYYLNAENQPLYWNSNDFFTTLQVFPTINTLDLSEPLLSRVLEEDEFNFSAENLEFLSNEITGTYNIDCFATRDFPNAQ